MCTRFDSAVNSHTSTLKLMTTLVSSTTSLPPLLYVLISGLKVTGNERCTALMSHIQAFVLLVSADQTDKVEIEGGDSGLQSGLSLKHAPEVEHRIKSSENKCDLSDESNVTPGEMRSPKASTPEDVSESGIESCTNRETVLSGGQESQQNNDPEQVKSNTAQKLDEIVLTSEDASEIQDIVDILESQGSTVRKSVIEMLMNAAKAKEQEQEVEQVVEDKASNYNDKISSHEYQAPDEIVRERQKPDTNDLNKDTREQPVDTSKKPVISQLVTNVVSSSGGSSEVTDASEEMGGTVIVKSEKIEKEDVRAKESVKDNEAHIDSTGFDPSLRLLSRVDFSDDTPVGTPMKRMPGLHDETDEEQVEGSISPGPLTTPNLSEISHDESEHDIVSEEEPTQTTDLYTQSTSLGKYMATNCEATLSTQTTLPHIQNVYQDDTLKGRTDSDVSSLRNTEENITPRSREDVSKVEVSSVQNTEENKAPKDVSKEGVIKVSSLRSTEEIITPQKDIRNQSKEGISKVQTMDKSDEKDVTVTSRVLNQSFTLAHPSPVLLAAEAKKSQTNSSKSTSSGRGPPRIQAVASSIEDLKLNSNSKAQRRLNYESPMKFDVAKDDVALADSEEHGKEEHMQRYLHSLSQMPHSAEVGFPNDFAQPDTTEEVCERPPTVLVKSGVSVEEIHAANMQALMVRFKEEQERLFEQQQQELAAFCEMQVSGSQHSTLGQSGLLHELGDVRHTLVANERANQIAQYANNLPFAQYANGQRQPQYENQMLHGASITQQHDYANDSRKPQYANDSTQPQYANEAQSAIPVTPQRSHTPEAPANKNRGTVVPPSPMAEKQKQRYDTWLRAPPPQPKDSPLHNLEHSVDFQQRPATAPVPKVSFLIDDMGKNHNPAGVFYDPPPLPSNVSISDQHQGSVLEQHQVTRSQEEFPSPAVLKRAHEESSVALDSRQIMNSSMSPRGSPANKAMSEPVSILKKSSPPQVTGVKTHAQQQVSKAPSKEAVCRNQSSVICNGKVSFLYTFSARKMVSLNINYRKICNFWLKYDLTDPAFLIPSHYAVILFKSVPVHLNCCD